MNVNAASDLITFFISSKMGAAQMGVYTVAEFTNGFKAMGVSTVDELKRKLSQFAQDMKNAEEYKKMYKFVFNYARDKAYKNLQIDLAIDLWELLVGGRAKFYGDWVEFLRTEKKDQLVITKDTWDMFYEMIEMTKGDIANFVDDGTWPPIIDAFVAYYNKKH